MGDSPDLAPIPTPSRSLNGWKAIAAYLDVDPRTAARWEKQLGLPIERKPGSSSVYAFCEKIDRWRRDTEMRRRRRNVTAAAVILMALAATIGWRLQTSVDRSPAAFNVSGNSLTVFSSSGALLWEHRFPFSLNERAYGAQDGPFESQGPVVFADIDGDGRREVLFLVDTVGKPEEVQLYCFDQHGTERFRYAPIRGVRFGAADYGPPFTVRLLWVAKNQKGPATIWIGASHLKWFPTVVQQLSAHGTPVSEYWTNGHVTVLKDVVVAGRRYMAVGGTSNEGHAASLALLNYDEPSGRAPTEDVEYLCTSCPQKDPVLSLKFPQSEVAKRQGDARPFVVEVSTLLDGGFQATVKQVEVDINAGRLVANVYYGFDSSLRLIHAKAGDDFLRATSALDLPSTARFDFLPIQRWVGRVFADDSPLVGRNAPANP